MGVDTNDRNTVSARTSVTLEDDIGTLIDGQAVVLVHDSAEADVSSIIEAVRSKYAIPVLDDEIVSAAIEPIGIVSCGLSVTLTIRLISSSYNEDTGLITKPTKATRERTIIDSKL